MVKYVNGILVILFHLTYFIVVSKSFDIPVFNVTTIPVPALILNVVPLTVALIKPPLNKPVYKLPSNHFKLTTSNKPSFTFVNNKSPVSFLTFITLLSIFVSIVSLLGKIVKFLLILTFPLIF